MSSLVRPLLVTTLGGSFPERTTDPFARHYSQQRSSGSQSTRGRAQERGSRTSGRRRRSSSCGVDPKRRCRFEVRFETFLPRLPLPNDARYAGHSLLPAPLHVKIAKLCIEHKAALVTASYTSAEMAALHEE